MSGRAVIPSGVEGRDLTNFDSIYFMLSVQDFKELKQIQLLLFYVT